MNESVMYNTCLTRKLKFISQGSNKNVSNNKRGGKI